MRNSSVCGTGSSLSVGRNAAKPASTRAVTIQIVRALRPTNRATRPQMPCFSLCSLPRCGSKGQNALRPSSTSTIGSRVSDESIAPAIPMAPTGPRPRRLDRSESSRQSRPRITVSPEATIGSSAPR